MTNLIQTLKRRMQELAGVNIAKIEKASAEKNKKNSEEEVFISEKQISQGEDKKQ